MFQRQLVWRKMLFRLYLLISTIYVVHVARCNEQRVLSLFFSLYWLRCKARPREVFVQGGFLSFSLYWTVFSSTLVSLQSSLFCFCFVGLHCSAFGFMCVYVCVYNYTACPSSPPATPPCGSSRLRPFATFPRGSLLSVLGKVSCG